jgi:hypothetical protein
MIFFIYFCLPTRRQPPSTRPQTAQRARGFSSLPGAQLHRCQRLYFCTSTASKVGTSPTNLSRISGPLTIICPGCQYLHFCTSKASKLSTGSRAPSACDSCRASSVLPHPGGPDSSIPGTNEMPSALLYISLLALYISLLALLASNRMLVSRRMLVWRMLVKQYTFYMRDAERSGCARVCA